MGTFLHLDVSLDHGLEGKRRLFCPQYNALWHRFKACPHSRRMATRRQIVRRIDDAREKLTPQHDARHGELFLPFLLPHHKVDQGAQWQRQQSPVRDSPSQPGVQPEQSRPRVLTCLLARALYAGKRQRQEEALQGAEETAGQVRACFVTLGCGPALLESQRASSGSQGFMQPAC